MHPKETELALLASGELSLPRRWQLGRHLSGCTACQTTVNNFTEIRTATLAEDLPPELTAGQWEALAREMRANIRLGLEAGECVREVATTGRWNFRPALAMACLLLLLATGLALRQRKGSSTPASAHAVPELASSEDGIEFRSGQTSLMLLNRGGVVADQTVSTQGEIRSRYIDGDSGAVTINNVYLQ
jgi:hypothetical protein